MSENHVVIYSNGIADFMRCYEVNPDAPRRISIPVRRDHLADVTDRCGLVGKLVPGAGSGVEHPGLGGHRAVGQSAA